MLEKFVSKMLNKYLSDYIENLDPDQLDITLRSGEIKLENLKIKPSVFDSMPVPFSLSFGEIGLI